MISVYDNAIRISGRFCVHTYPPSLQMKERRRSSDHSSSPIEVDGSSSRSDSPTNDPNIDQRQRATALLDMIRRAAMGHSKIHKHHYRWLKRALHGYQVIVMMLNAANAFLSSAGKPYLDQSTLSTTSTVLSSICAVITSLVIFFNFQANMDADLASHKQYYALAIDVLGALVEVPDDIVTVANQKCREYIQIKHASNVVDDSGEDDVMSSISWSERDLDDNDRSDTLSAAERGVSLHGRGRGEPERKRRSERGVSKIRRYTNPPGKKRNKRREMQPEYPPANTQKQSKPVVFKRLRPKHFSFSRQFRIAPSGRSVDSVKID